MLGISFASFWTEKKEKRKPVSHIEAEFGWEGDGRCLESVIQLMHEVDRGSLGIQGLVQDFLQSVQIKINSVCFH